MSEDIETTEVPPINRDNLYRRADVKWEAIASRLRMTPGEWQFIGRFTSSTVTHIKSGRLVACRPAGHYQATGRNIGENGRIDVYARFVGDGDG
jgi:hypothetical protein